MSEVTYYVLLALLKPGHGYKVMQDVEELSDGTVRLAAGTMYGALENLRKKKLIYEVEAFDPRRKNYQITELGKKLLLLEVERLSRQIRVYNNMAKGVDLYEEN